MNKNLSTVLAIGITAAIFYFLWKKGYLSSWIQKLQSKFSSNSAQQGNYSGYPMTIPSMPLQQGGMSLSQVFQPSVIPSAGGYGMIEVQPPSQGQYFVSPTPNMGLA
jgi:hypothetical protein